MIKDKLFIVLVVLIVLDIAAIVYYSNQYCFTYKEVGKPEIHECGDKKVLEAKYHDYLVPKNQSILLFNLSNFSKNG